MVPPASPDRQSRKGEQTVVGRQASAVLLGWAMARPIVQILRNHLPAYEGRRAKMAPGLYAETGPSPVHRGKAGELRLSVLRVHAVTDGGFHILLGQLHVTSLQFPDGGEDRRVRFYAHEQEGPAIQEFWCENEWWVSLMDRYYDMGGPLVDLGPSVEP